jgi:Asp-tRNA(Asn)/Glu-tRNA(Gln) amidotransferase A subunit family amidase
MKKLCVVLLALVILFAAWSLYWYIKWSKGITTWDIKAAEKIAGLSFTGKERKMMLRGLESSLSSYQELRQIDLPNSVPPALLFNPLPFLKPRPSPPLAIDLPADPELSVPENPDELAFYPVTALARLIRQKKITSVQLTRLYLDRLKKYGPELHCVITLTEDLAQEQARRADAEIAAGRYRGPLHGIPWGAKDLLATKGIKTTWGAMPYKDQMIQEDATVVERLEEAGAVLVAKLTMGALAMGDVWYEGKTRNPWNLEEGSSGSSAGSAASASAGLVGFAIGTETLGSIVSPSTRCGVTGLRPTFGRVSRHGAMALSWSMDKIGPICRSAEDCALVFNAIYGPDGKDASVLPWPFEWDAGRDLAELRIGYLKDAFEADNRNQENNQAVLEVFQKIGVDLIPVELPDMPVGAMRFVLSAEAAAAFDELTRSNRDDLLVRQTRGSWPNSFRRARLIPAVEYIQANRARSLLMLRMTELMRDIDVYLAPNQGSSNLLITNLTGHPTVVVPTGFNSEGSPTSISFVGALMGEAAALRVAKAYQDATDYHLKHPDLDANIAAYRDKQAEETGK